MDLEPNTLVTIQGKPHYGICCIAKIFKNQYNVNIGTQDVQKINKKKCIPVDITNCKTITFQQFKHTILDANPKKQGHDGFVIVGNELMKYVGIGWITQRVINYNDLKKYPRVI